MSFYRQATGYIIHQRKFKNNSQIIEFYSREFGKIQLIGKGINKNKQLFSQLQLFSLAKVQYFGGSSLKNLTSINLLENNCFKDLLLNASGLYLNELIHLSVQELEASDFMFNSYQQALRQLGKVKLAKVLRKFEWQLLKHNGFEIRVDNKANPSDWVVINENYDLIVQASETNAFCQVADLHQFIEGLPMAKPTQFRINKLMEQALKVCLSNRKIYSKELIKSIINSSK